MEPYSDPPPPYSLEDVPPPRRDPNQFTISRKPIARKAVQSGDTRPKTSGDTHGSPMHSPRLGEQEPLPNSMLRGRSPNMRQPVQPEYSRPKTSSNNYESAKYSSRLGDQEPVPNSMLRGRSPNIRKPVHSEDSRPKTSGGSYGSSMHSFRGAGGPSNSTLRASSSNMPPSLPPRSPGLSVTTSFPAKITDQQLYASPGFVHSNPNLSALSATTSTNASSPNTPLSTPSPSITSADSQSSAAALVQKAYREARHFAGGLISHPTESTKHFTILRHSHGLVFYQGVATTLAVSIFSDAPLPADRTIWLQSKGWSGKTGMRAKALFGRNGDWINATPKSEVRSEQVKPEDERAWQRDISHFQKKGPRNIREKHILRETAVIRIPTEAGDGYFQVVLCIGDKKKVLCPSPSFRVLSTSTSPHSLRGASLSTLPLELGAMAIGVYARNTAGRVVGPVTSVIQNRVVKYMPSWWTREALEKTYARAGVSDTVNATIENGTKKFIQTRDGSYIPAGTHEILPEQGPQPPYPIEFSARSGLDSEYEMNPGIVPILNLSSIREDISQRLNGYYFGYARPRPSKHQSAHDPDSWSQIILTSLLKHPSQIAQINITSLNSREISLHPLDPFPIDEEDENQPPSSVTTSQSSKKNELQIQILGFIRPDEPLQRATLLQGLQQGDEAASEASILTEANDISFSQNILNQPAWGVREKDNGERPNTLERLASGYSSARMAVQRGVDRVPLNLVGVRMEVDGMREKGLGGDGFWIRRS